MKTIIRLAHKTDIPALEAFLAAGYDETGDQLPPYDWADIYHQFVNIIRSGMAFVAVELDDDNRGQLVGALMLDAKKNYAGHLVLENVHWYVQPDVRAQKTEGGRLIADALLDAAKDLSTRAGVPLIIRMMFGSRADSKDTYMGRQGFDYLGGNWIFLPPPREQGQQQEGQAAA